MTVQYKSKINTHRTELNMCSLARSRVSRVTFVCHYSTPPPVNWPGERSFGKADRILNILSR